MGEPIAIRMGVRARQDVLQAKVAVTIMDTMGRVIVELSSEKHGNRHYGFSEGQTKEISVTLPHQNFLPGRHAVKIALKDVRAGRMLDLIASAHAFFVVPANVYGTGRVIQTDGVVFMRSEWSEGNTDGR